MKSSSNVKLGNLIGYVLFPFTIALREDALDYVRSAKATGKRKKATLEAIYTYFMAKTFNKFFGAKALMIHVVSYANKINIILSVDEGIVPDPHQLCDDLEESLRLIKDAVIYKGFVDFEEGIVPDPRQLCNDLEESLTVIKDAVIYKGLVDCNVY
ncbi:hypothetical protein DKX38_029516 [Salix brachista]|uniref:O-acyltransferase WSD1 C-terminal domain-containing protein n=1 Tax=Salix brachista TaxID=2182728 RepID=A0A5N5IZD0_9ROSI|nr:hypothetical protein DKX38_029516 [Salix brachista]